MPKLTKTALRRKQPVTDELLIPDDAQRKLLDDARAAVIQTEHGLSLARIGGESDEKAAEQRLMDARAHLDDVKEAIRKTGLSIVLVSAGQEKYNEVQLSCPPTAEQKTKSEESGEDELLYDPAAFWPALIAASVPDSDLTAEDWRREVFESKAWGPAELKDLRERLVNLYTTSRIADLGN